MDHTPPPFFKRGPAPLVRLFFFASLSLALLVIDARFRYAEGLRSWLALAAYPVQRAEVLEVHDELVAAAGLPAVSGLPPIVHYSPGVDVEVFALEAV